MEPGASGSVELLRRCHRNLAEGLWQYVRFLVGASRRDLPGAILVRCRLPAHLVNTAVLTDPAGRAEALLAEASTFFGRETPWRVITTGNSEPEVGARARAMGLRPAANEPGMVLDPIPGPRPPPTSLTIRDVSDLTTFADFGQVWSVSFRIPAWVLPIALPQLPPDDPERGVQNRQFVGYAGKVPVACATVAVSERVAGIASVGTIPKARGNGYGTAMTARAAEVGKTLGAEVAYLLASAQGYPVYARMGFRKVATYPSWQVPVGFFRSIRILRFLRQWTRSGSPPGSL